MEFAHITHNVRISPRKLRLVADKIRYMSAQQALEILPLVINRGALITHKSLKSAVQVAEDRNLSLESLVVQRVWCDEGRKLKRAVSRSKGRTLPILKRSSHLTIVLKGEPAVRSRRVARKSETPDTSSEQSPVEE
jgi:large subunit ribosomal protein L22